MCFVKEMKIDDPGRERESQSNKDMIRKLERDRMRESERDRRRVRDRMRE